MSKCLQSILFLSALLSSSSVISDPASLTQPEEIALKSVFESLPNDTVRGVLSFVRLSPKDRYILLINSPPFLGFLERASELAGLMSPREAVDYFWRFCKGRIQRGCDLRGVTGERYLVILGSREQIPEKVEKAFRGLIRVAKRFMSLRSILLSWIEVSSRFDTDTGCLIGRGVIFLDHKRYQKAYHGLGLLASVPDLKLFIKDKSIISLNPLSHLVNLSELELQCRITSAYGILPLSHLTTLRVLKLGSMNLSDVSPLSTLVGLEELRIAHNPVSDISTLSALTRLSRLALVDTKVADLRPLSSLLQLRVLNLQHSLVEDLRPLSGLTSLERLNVLNNPTTDLSPLSGLVQLSYLD